MNHSRNGIDGPTVRNTMFDGGTELTEEQKQELVNETKAALIAETKADIQKIHKLVADERKKYEEFLEGKITKADFETYQAKSLEAENAIKARIDAVETKLNRPEISGQETKTEISPEAKEYKAGFFNFLRKGVLELTDKAKTYIAERKALVSDTTGNILIPEELESEIYRELPKINVIRNLAFVRTIASNKIRRRSLTEVKMGWGKLELGKEPVETDVVPGEAWQHVEDMEGLARIGKDELADTDVALESIIVDSFGRARAETEETGFVLGKGHDYQEPEGLLTGTTLTRVLTAHADLIAADDILNLIYEVPKPYRRNGTILWNSKTTLAVRKLKDKNEQYLWQPSVQAGQPSTFAGYPIEEQEDIPLIASATSCDIAIFGDLKAGYRILDRQGMTIQRLTELFSLAGLIGILVSSRTGGGVIRPNALRVLRESTIAA